MVHRKKSSTTGKRANDIVRYFQFLPLTHIARLPKHFLWPEEFVFGSPPLSLLDEQSPSPAWAPQPLLPHSPSCRLVPPAAASAVFGVGPPTEIVVVMHVAVKHVLPVVAEPKVPVVVEGGQAVHVVIEACNVGKNELNPYNKKIAIRLMSLLWR